MYLFGLDLLFPDRGAIDSITYGWGWFDITALSLPLVQGTPGNIEGDGIGFFYGYTPGEELDLTVTNPGK